MLLPYTVDVPMSRIPFANWVLIGATTVASVILYVEHFQREREVLEKWVRAAREMKAPPPQLREAVEKALKGEPRSFPWSLKRGESFSAAQLLSYQLVHAGPLHLVGNMVFLFVFGNAVNAKLGHLPFLGCYFGLGVLAGLAWLLLGHGPEVVGASGAIMGLVGVFLVLFPKNDVTVLYALSLGRAGSVSVPAFLVILSYMVSDLLGAAFGSGPVAYVAHLVGLFAGAALACVLVGWGWVRSERYEENLLQAVGMLPRRKDEVDYYWEQKRAGRPTARRRLR
jgi:membrane associated rhomboid family serine protease